MPLVKTPKQSKTWTNIWMFNDIAVEWRDPIFKSIAVPVWVGFFAERLKWIDFLMTV